MGDTLFYIFSRCFESLFSQNVWIYIYLWILFTSFHLNRFSFFLLCGWLWLLRWHCVSVGQHFVLINTLFISLKWIVLNIFQSTALIRCNNGRFYQWHGCMNSVSNNQKKTNHFINWVLLFFAWKRKIFKKLINLIKLFIQFLYKVNESPSKIFDKKRESPKKKKL